MFTAWMDKANDDGTVEETIETPEAGCVVTVTERQHPVNGTLSLTAKGGKLTLKHQNDDHYGFIKVKEGGTLSLTNVILTGADSSSTSGGAITNSKGSVTLTDSLVTGNKARDGGGIFNQGGTLKLTNTTVTNNRAEAQQKYKSSGGGIYNSDGGTATLDNSKVTDNIAVAQRVSEDDDLNAYTASYGGGIYNSAATLVLTGSTVSGNKIVVEDGTTAYGGGIYGAEGAVTLKSSTVTGNEPDDCSGTVEC